MEDSRIVALYWERDQEAIRATAEKYGRYCHTIANHILANREDADECVNDTYLIAWNEIPPHKPGILSTFLGKITRRVSLNKWRDKNRDKRGAGEVPLALDELSECIYWFDNESIIIATTDADDSKDYYLYRLKSASE